MKLLVYNNPIVTPTPSRLKWSIWNDIISITDNTIVVFNTLTQNAVLMEQNEYGQIENLSEESIMSLYGIGILVATDIDENSKLEQRFIEGKKDMSYIDLTILLTHNCQFNCSYCFEGTKENVNLDDATADKIIHFLENYASECRKLRVTWFGGEPLMAYKQLKILSTKLIAFCRDNNIEYVADITTNGYALTSDYCKVLVYELNVRRYIITIDGPADIHNHRRPLRSGRPTFARIWNNINILVENNAWVTLRMTIDRENASHIPKLLDEIAQGKFAKRVGLSFCRTIDYNYTPHNIKNNLFSENEFADVEWNLIQYAHKLGLWHYSFPHAAPTGGCLRDGDIVIGATGEIYKCLDTVGDKRWQSGDIENFTTLSRPLWYENWLAWTPMQSSTCRSCTLQPLCNGGCPHNALFQDKKHGTATQCPDWKANYQRQIKALVEESVL